MIQVIIEIKEKNNKPKFLDILEDIKSNVDFNFSVFIVLEMIDDTYSLVFKTMEDMYVILSDIDEDFNFKVIGGYYSDGTTAGFVKRNKVYKKNSEGEDVLDYIEEEDDSSKNHTLKKWKDQLRDIITYDENGDPNGTRKPTDEDAANMQAGSIYGWMEKELN